MNAPRLRILEVFNRYLFYGGEEKIADWIADDLALRHEVRRCGFHSREWTEPGAPGKLGQVRRLFYNHDSRRRFEEAAEACQPQVALFHNVYPVGSPSLYHAAKLENIPVVQYVHNFRPFSVGGSLFVNGNLTEQAMSGRMWPEIRRGAWQGSVVKSALMALALKRLIRSGWLDQVKVWICISDFMKRQFAKAGVPEERLVVLKHPWLGSEGELSFGEAQESEDGGYLFLGRLVEEKGVRVLLNAWNELWKRLQQHTPSLWIAGEGPLEAEVRHAAERNPSIQYLGMLRGAEKQKRLSQCRAVVVPSVWWEPLGLVVYEAYQAKKPVLAAASGGLTETVQHQITGLLHEPGNARALAQSVIQLEQLPHEERQKWGRSGHQWLQQYATVETWRAQMDETLLLAIRSQ
jgi:glycosyltransferase involved in cell wall biosynthesis